MTDINLRLVLSAQTAQMERALAGVRRTIGTLLGGLTAVQIGRAFVRAADDAQLLAARLKLATRGADELAAAQQALFATAQKLQVPLADLVGSYTRFADVVRANGGGVRETVDLVDALAASARLSGATVSEAAASVQQFGQAMQSGRLQGDELRSVLENNRRLVQALTAALGVSVGQLREMGEAGQLTSDVVLRAIQSQIGVIQAEAATLPRTVAGAIVELRNSLAAAADTANRASGLTADLATVIGAVSTGIADMARASADAGTQLDRLGRVDALREIAVAIGTIVDGIRLAVRLLAQFADSVSVIAQDLAALGAIATTALDLRRGVRERAEGIRAILEERNRRVEEANRRFEARFNAPVDLLENRIRAAFDRAASGGAIGSARGPLNLRQFEQQATAAAGARIALPGATGGTRTRRGGDETDALVRAAESVQERVSDARLQMQQTELARATRALEESLAARLLSEADYERQRAQLAADGIDAEIARARESQVRLREIAGDTGRAADERLRASGEIIGLDAQIAELEQRRDAELAAGAQRALEATRDLRAELTAVREELAAAGERSAADLLAASQRGLAPLRDRLSAAGDTAGVADVDRLAALRAAQAELDAMRQRADLVRERGDTAEQRAINARKAGLISELQLRERVREAHVRVAAEVAALIPRMRELAAAAGDPRQAEQIERLAEEMRSLGEVADSIGQQIGASLEGPLTGFFADFISGAKSASDAFADFGRAVINQIIQILAQQAALQTLSFFGFHSGGVVGAGGTAITGVNPLAFLAAPRLHAGGLLGLQPGEMPIIAQVGEEILTRDDPRHRANGGAAGSVAIQQTFVLGEPASRRTQEQLAREAADGTTLALGRRL